MVEILLPAANVVVVDFLVKNRVFFICGWSAFSLVIANPSCASTSAKPAATSVKANRATAYERCVGESYYTDVIRACAAAENRRANILLDIAYRKALATLPPDRKKALRQSHTNWQKRVTVECDNDPKVLSVEGGTLWPIFYTECFIAKTKARTKWLQKNMQSRVSKF
jgi:uncharacterized protein YecT (DUF1311 family)